MPASLTMDFLFEGSAIVFVAILGASIGSFLNVVIYRLPAGLSLSHPPSRCPHCLTPLRKRENVPIFGWFMLKGKCAHCGAAISFRYPLVEAIVMLLFLATYLFYGFSLQTIGYWVFISYLLALALIDLDTLTLSNRLMKSGLVLGLGFQTAIAAGTGSFSSTVMGFLWAVISTVMGLWLLDIVTWLGRLSFGPNAMGGGDAKLFAMIGAWLGWKLMLMAGLLACSAGSIFGLIAIALKIMKRGNPMPFGPFLALGAILSVFYGEFLVSGYWMLMGKLYGN
jgi:leader peptidase (prepilin peptidase) / N-methyltransferase